MAPGQSGPAELAGLNPYAHQDYGLGSGSRRRDAVPSSRPRKRDDFARSLPQLNRRAGRGPLRAGRRNVERDDARHRSANFLGHPGDKAASPILLAAIRA